MSLRHAILGVLSVQPMTGYDLADYFVSTGGLFWQAGQAQIYPELRRMEADRLLSVTIAPRGKLAKKRIYTMTETGTAELKRWVEEPVTYAADRDPAHVKVNYFDMASRESSKAFFEAHIAHYSSRLRHWEVWVKAMRARSDPLIARRLATRPTSDHEAIVEFRAFALDGQIARAKLEISWARQGLKLLEALPKPVSKPRNARLLAKGRATPGRGRVRRADFR